MKISEALKLWAVNQLGSTVDALNDYLASVGKPPHSLDEGTVDVSFSVSKGAACPHGHTAADDCFETVPDRPVLRVSGRTKQGQKLFADTHTGDQDFTLTRFLTSVINTAGENVTV